MDINIVSYHVYFLNYFLKSNVEKNKQDFACLFFGNVYLMTFSRTVFLSNDQGHFGLFFHIVYFTLQIYVFFFHGQILLFSVSIVLGQSIRTTRTLNDQQSGIKDYIQFEIYIQFDKKKNFLQLTSNDLIPKVFKTINTVVYSFYKYFFYNI